MSLVPNRETARSFSEAAKRSMNCVPTAVISDVDDPASPQTSSLTPSATRRGDGPGEPRRRYRGRQSHAPVACRTDASRGGAASRFQTITRRRK